MRPVADRLAAAADGGVIVDAAGNAALDFVPAGTPIDLTNCDREPIHTPGTIQPHGALLALAEPDLAILQASANCGALLGVEASALLGRTVAEAFGAAVADAVLDALRRGGTRGYAPVSLGIDAAGTRRDFDAVAERSAGVVLLELEPAPAEPRLSPAAFYDLVREAAGHVEHSRTLVELAQAIAGQMRHLTGFDRVWVYRFHEDWHGEIIAEAKADGIESWLGMHYPASDIPAQARALFLKHWVRVIPDLAFTPVPMIPVLEPRTGRPLDMGGAALRGVSPVHVQYLRNMGVAASFTVSLVRDGRLWGLVSSHHYSGPKLPPHETRTLCELLAHSFAMQLGAAEHAEDAAGVLAVRGTLAALVRRVEGRVDDVARALVDGEPSLGTLTDADGAAACIDGSCTTTGRVPAREQLDALVRWLTAGAGGALRDGLFATNALATHFPAAAEFADVASGLLAAAVGTGHPNFLLWFRGENRQVVPWAGEPRKYLAVGDDGVARLTPRGSFELWEETVRGTAREWRTAEIEGARDLRRTVIEILLARTDRVMALNAELEAANEQLRESAVELEVQAEELAAQTDELRASTDELLEQREAREQALDREREARTEAERANSAKADFLAMMSHELRTPLNAIGGYAQLMELGLRGPVTEEQKADIGRIRAAQQHLLGLINDILNFARIEAGHVQYQLANVPVATLLQSLESLVGPDARSKGLTFELTTCDGEDGAPLTVHADPERLRQVLLNLVSNAVKFTPAGGAVTVACELADPASSGTDGARAVAIRVRDTGRGIPADRLTTVFDPFVQVDRHLTNASQQGVGLGLAISRDLARAMGGELTAESVPEEGSTFTVTMPRGEKGE